MRLMKYKLVGMALTIIGAIALTILYYAEYILINPIDPILWYLVVIVVVLGAILILLSSFRRKPTLTPL